MILRKDENDNFDINQMCTLQITFSWSLKYPVTIVL